MKKAERILTLVTLPIDLLMVLIAFVLAYAARSHSIPLPVVYIWPFQQYIIFALCFLPVYAVAFALAGLYSKERSGMKEIGQIFAGASLGAMAVVMWVFLNRSDFFSRLIVFYIWILSIIGVSLGRTIIGFIRSNLYLFGVKRKRLAIAGSYDEAARHIAKQVATRSALGYEVVGIISEGHPEGIKRLGGLSETEKIIENEKLDEIIATGAMTDDKLFALMRSCQERGIDFKAIPTHAQVGARTLQFEAFAGIPMIQFCGTALDNWGAVIKRLIDIVGSVIAIVVLSPIMLIIAIAIKLDSKGPVIYKNTRTGNNGDFKTLKFRTMFVEVCTGNEYGGSRAEEIEDQLIKEKNMKDSKSAVYKIVSDPRVTRVGSFLRKTSLDELPQFFNVFIGNMSLVGPRPHQPKEVKNYSNEQRKLLMIKPGISGLAQISGRSDLSFDEEVKLDIFYLENWSVWLDLYIILRTFSTVIKGKGSY